MDQMLGCPFRNRYAVFRGLRCCTQPSTVQWVISAGRRLAGPSRSESAHLLVGLLFRGLRPSVSQWWSCVTLVTALRRMGGRVTQTANPGRISRQAQRGIIGGRYVQGRPASDAGASAFRPASNRRMDTGLSIRLLTAFDCRGRLRLPAHRLTGANAEEWSWVAEHGHEHDVQKRRDKNWGWMRPIRGPEPDSKQYWRPSARTRIASGRDERATP